MAVRSEVTEQSSGVGVPLAEALLPDGQRLTKIALGLSIPALGIAVASEAAERLHGGRVLLAKDLLLDGQRLTVIALRLPVASLPRAVDPQCEAGLRGIGMLLAENLALDGERLTVIILRFFILSVGIPDVTQTVENARSEFGLVAQAIDRLPKQVFDAGDLTEVQSQSPRSGQIHRILGFEFDALEIPILRRREVEAILRQGAQLVCRFRCVPGIVFQNPAKQIFGFVGPTFGKGIASHPHSFGSKAVENGGGGLGSLLPSLKGVGLERGDLAPQPCRFLRLARDRSQQLFSEFLLLLGSFLLEAIFWALPRLQTGPDTDRNAQQRQYHIDQPGTGAVKRLSLIHI